MKLLLFLTFTLFATTGSAAVVRDLGKVSIKVVDRSADTRTEALSEGLEQVLTRLTGLRHPKDAPGPAAILASEPSRWVLQYSYEKLEPEEETAPEQLTGEGEAAETPTLRLSAAFDVDALSQRLGESAAPVWGRQRPAVLFWVVEQGPAHGRFLSRDDEGPATDALRETGEARGLPVLLPSLDGEDRRNLRPADVRGRFDGPVLEASQRYGTGLVVTAVLYQGSEPHLRWRLLDGGEEVQSGDLRDGEATHLLSELVHRVTGHVADLYAVRGNAGSEVRLRVHELSDLQDWKTARDYLHGLAGMQALHIESLEATTVTFAGRFSGEIKKLERLVELQPALGSCPALGTDVRSEPLSGPGSATETDDVASPRVLEFCWSHGR